MTCFEVCHDLGTPGTWPEVVAVADNLAASQWSVHADVYRWISATEVALLDPPSTSRANRGLDAPYLVTSSVMQKWPTVPLWSTAGGKPRPGVVVPRPYDPLREYTALFRTFAATEPTEDGILAFAKKYGHLGVAAELGLSGSDEPYQFRVFGESLRTWVEEIEHLRHAVEVWQKILAGDRKSLEPHVRWRASDSVSYETHPALEPAARPSWALSIALHAWDVGPYELLEHLRSEPILEPARLLVHGLINQRLSQHVTKRLLFDDSRLHDVPKNLLGALWLQFAQAVSGNRSYASCKHCGTWFELSPGMRRRNALYCTDACRFKAYRERQEEARRLHVAGTSVADIIRQLGVDERSVARWLDRGAGGRRVADLSTPQGKPQSTKRRSIPPRGSE